MWWDCLQIVTLQFDVVNLLIAVRTLDPPYDSFFLWLVSPAVFRSWRPFKSTITRLLSHEKHTFVMLGMTWYLSSSHATRLSHSWYTTWPIPNFLILHHSSPNSLNYMYQSFLPGIASFRSLWIGKLPLHCNREWQMSPCKANCQVHSNSRSTFPNCCF